MKLNEQAAQICETIPARFERLRIRECHIEGGARRFDFGIDAEGGLGAGVLLAEICTAGLAEVNIVMADSALYRGPAVSVRTDQPVAACMAAQYAGWQVSEEAYFAMGSGPMRAAAAREDLFQSIGFHEEPSRAVGILESAQLPPPSVCDKIARDCGVEPHRLSLLVAPTSSQAGTVQVVARSVETALHKMFELGIELESVISGCGCAPLPPVASDDLTGIGRTNDAVLYGGQITLWMRAEDGLLESMVGQIPSSASTDYGEPFAEIFARHGRDFYQIDPHLFSPARVTLVNLDSGRTFTAGELRSDLIQKSFLA